MSSARIEGLKWADGEYAFDLKLKQIDELERIIGIGGTPLPFGTLAQRIESGHFRARDIYEVIRLGHIGAGMPPTDAKTKVDTYVDGCALANPHDPSSPLRVARAIVLAVFIGLPDTGEPGAGTKEDASTSRPSKDAPSDLTGSPSTSKNTASPKSSKSSMRTQTKETRRSRSPTTSSTP